MDNDLKYITNEAGEKTSVILSVADYESLIEDVHDLAAIAERREEPTIPHDQFIEELKKDGLI